jgi:hypothetical protein
MNEILVQQIITSPLSFWHNQLQFAKKWKYCTLFVILSNKNTSLLLDLLFVQCNHPSIKKHSLQSD